MKKLLLLLLITLSYTTINAQTRADNWYFGSNIELNFDNQGVPTLNQINTILTNEGSSVISDEDGGLLFYTDGISIWDKNHAEVATGLNGDFSSTNSSIIIPATNNKDQYFVFTVDVPDPKNIGNNEGLCYTQIDGSTNAVTGKNKPLVSYDVNDNEQKDYKCSEKVTATEIGDCSGFWVVTHFIDTFYSFKVTDTVDELNPVKTKTNFKSVLDGYFLNAAGYIKISPQGDRLAICHNTTGDAKNADSGTAYLYDFDNATGKVSNERVLTTNERVYGAEFSPDGSKLYISVENTKKFYGGNDAGRLIQFSELNNNTPTRTNILENRDFKALQLAPNGKIYAIVNYPGRVMDVINKPNELGTNCDYQGGVIFTPSGTSTTFGLPQFVTSFLIENIDITNDDDIEDEINVKLCEGQPHTLLATNDINADTFIWKKDGVLLNETGPSYSIKGELGDAGTYTVRATAKGGCDRVKGVAVVTITPQPKANPVKSLVVCDSDGESKIFDLTENDATILGNQDADKFIITYHLSQDDADKGVNPIKPAKFFQYNPNDGIVTIYIRIQSKIENKKTDSICFDTTQSFNIGVSPPPKIGAIDTFEACDDMPIDGKFKFDLKSYDSQILDGQDPKSFLVTYHLTQADADSGDNPLVSPYENTTANEQIIYVRVEIIGNKECYSNKPITLKVNPAPKAINAELSQCDNKDFNLNDAIPQITDGEADVTVTFYKTKAGAETEDPAQKITQINPYTITNTTETIYVRVSSKNECVNFSELVLILKASADATFTMKPSCTGAIVTKKGTEGGVFSFDPAPTDGATIDPNSGEIKNGTAGTTYTVKYKITGDCEAESKLNITLPKAPEITDPSPLQACDDDPIDGFTLFNLEEKNDEISGGNTAYVISYHLTQAEADANTGALPLKDYRNATKDKQIVYVRVVGEADDCVSYTTLELIVIKDPDASFTVTINCYSAQATPTIAGGIFTLDPAPTDGATIDPKTGLLTGGKQGQTYTIKYSITEGCEAESSKTITLIDGLDFTKPQELKVCDEVPLDGLAEFDLKSKDVEIVNGNATYSVTYHKTKADAEAGINPLPNPYENEDKDTQVVYAHITDSQTDCEAVTPLTLFVTETADASFIIKPSCTGATVTKKGTEGGVFSFDPAPTDGATIDPSSGEITNGTPGATYTIKYTITGDCEAESTLDITLLEAPKVTDPSPLQACDDDPIDGFTLFDLEARNGEISGGNTTYVISYHLTQAEADANTGALPLKGYRNATKDKQMVYVRVVGKADDCVSYTTLELIVIKDPDASFTVTPNCYSAQATATVGGGVYSLEPVPTDGATIDPNTGLLTGGKLGQTYTIKYSITQGCEADSSQTVTLLDGLDYKEPQELKVCDEAPLDGFAEFDLKSKDAEIVNGNATYSVTYHKTQADAEAGINPLISPYTNEDKDTQIVYAHVTDSKTDCEAVTPLTLVVTEVADAGFTVESTCDGAIVVTTIIGGGIFTLDPDPGLPVTIDPNTGTVTGGTFPATYTIRYSITGTCEASETREVAVLESPEAIIPKDLIQCDEEGDVDGIAIFDLTLAIPEITNNNPDLSVQFFETKQQAEDGTDPITNPKAYTNSTPTKQTLFVKVTSRLECSAFTTLTIRVLPNPSPGIPITLEECDDDNDGVAIFDLTINEPYVINNETDVILSYYRSLTDAQLKQNEINNPKQYSNESNPQTIYVRIDNMGDSEEAQLGCYAITSFEIKVNKIPDFNVTIEDFVVCDDDGDGQYAFDLETKTAEILNNTDSKSKYKVTYHETQAEADSGDNALASLYINKPPSPQTIYVRIEDKITRCANTKYSFLLIVNSRPDINSDKEPLVLEECDDNVELDKNPANDSTVFDIASITPEVLDGLDPATHIVSYYTSQENADSGTNPITNLSQFTNTTNPQIIYIRVDNTDNTTKDCYATTTLTLIVNPLPYVNLDDYYLICQETNGTEVTGEVEIDTELSKKDYSFEWTIQGSTEILSKDSSYTPTQGGIYTVKVVNKLTLCEAFDTTTVTVSTPPILSAAVLGLEFTINQSIKVIASSTGLSSKYEFSLDDGPWLKNSPNNNTYIFKNVVPGPHTIKVRDINGCGVSETTVFVLGYPPFFTPNNDGYNDTWQIYGIENFPGTKIHIFDRFGKLLKQISPMGDGWDGSLNGRPLPSTDYWFSVQYIDKKTNTPKQFKAHFTLKR